MGNQNSKSSPRGPDGDEKYMTGRFPGCLDYMIKWQKKFGVDKKLKVEQWREVVVKLEGSVASKCGARRERKQKELQCAKMWLRAAEERREQIVKAKQRKLKNDEAASMFVRPEDNETQVGRRPPQTAAPPQGESAPSAAAAAVSPTATPAQMTDNIKTYPDLSGSKKEPLHDLSPTNPFKSPLMHYGPQPYGPQPPPNTFSPMWLRSHSKTLPYQNAAEHFPMIQVANPNLVNGQPAHMYVYRPWTLEEARKAVEGCTPAKEDPAQWAEDMRGVILSYRLNGHEAGQAVMTSLGKDWFRVRGDYTGTDGNRVVFPAPDNEPATLGAAFEAQWTALIGRVAALYRRRADYGHLAGVKQKPEEDVEDFRLRFEKEFRVHSGIDFNADGRSVYQQQLKNGLLTGFHSDIANWIRIHHVESAESTVNQTMQWARHAEKVINEKLETSKEKSENPDVFYSNDFGSSNSTVFFHGGQRGGGRGRGRGRGRGQRPFQSGRDKSSEECWNCGECGHWSRNCPKKKQDNHQGGRGDKGRFNS